MGWSGIEQWLPPCVIPLTLPPSADLLRLWPHVWGLPATWIDLLKAPSGWERPRARSLALVCGSIPFRGTLHGGELTASPPHPTSPLLRLPLLLFSAPPPHRDNQAYVKTTCSFDSHQLISDPIKPKSAIVRRWKCLKSACAGERGCALYPANHSWHSCPCCHGLGSEVEKTGSMSWLRENSGALKEGLSAQRPHWSANAGGKCRQVRAL